MSNGRLLIRTVVYNSPESGRIYLAIRLSARSLAFFALHALLARSLANSLTPELMR